MDFGKVENIDGVAQIINLCRKKIHFSKTVISIKIKKFNIAKWTLEK